MNLNECKAKIERYLKRDEYQPIVVDVQNYSDLTDLKNQYRAAEGCEYIPASKYCNPDEAPRLDALLADLQELAGASFVFGVDFFLKMQGEEALRRFLAQVLGMGVPGRVVFVTYRCARYMPTDRDPRLERRVYVVDGAERKTPRIVLVAPGTPLPEKFSTIKSFDKLADLPKKVKKNGGAVYVVTKKKKESFPNSLYVVEKMESAYDALALFDPTTKTLPQSAGTDELWSYALDLFKESETATWKEIAHSFLSRRRTLTEYKNWSVKHRWTFYIATKLFGTKDNLVIDRAASVAKSFDEFPKLVMEDIFASNPKDKDYWDKYDHWRAARVWLGGNKRNVKSFCDAVANYGDDAICYLTDLTEQERELAFELLARSGSKLSSTKLLEILGRVYPDLRNYLLPYDFGGEQGELLNEYFREYKRQKVVNKISDEFLAKVQEQAEKREYNRVLSPRSAIVERLDRTNSKLYFMDAMGVEFLGFIAAFCRSEDYNLDLKVQVCRAELPSTTEYNKEFCDLFESSGVPIAKVRSVDETKHHGKSDDDYESTDKPIYLIDELRDIRDALEKIAVELEDGKFDRVFMIADHGASRLAVLYANAHKGEERVKMAEKGDCSGRRCRKRAVDVPPKYAVDAGDYWVLANYESFSGGRNAEFEVHGGATLDEICVPVIEITRRTEKLVVVLADVDRTMGLDGSAPTIMTSFKKKAAFLVVVRSGSKLGTVRVEVGGKSYDAVDQGDGKAYRVDAPDLKKAGDYLAKVYSDGKLVADDLPFAIKKEGQTERDLL